MSHSRRIPKLCHHKASGKAVVRLDGRDYYLGPWGSPEAQQGYERMIAEWLAGGSVRRSAGTPVTVAMLASAYIAWAEGYYLCLRSDGTMRGQVQVYKVKQAASVLLHLYADTPAGEFGPLKLDVARSRMVQLDWTRSYVNSAVGILKRMFKWGVSRELVPTTTADALDKLENLQKGRTAAREGRKVGPVAPDHVRAVQAHVFPQVAAMIELQLLTGMRPGEVCAPRPMDVARDGRTVVDGQDVTLPGCWIYVPPDHKQAYRGSERFVLLGPACQAVLAPYLDRPPEAYYFSPAEAFATAGRSPGRRRTREVGQCYRRESYSRAIAAGCVKAGVPHWHPHQLRHARASEIGSAFSPEHARIMLGHTDLNTTRRYMVDDLLKAAEAARKCS